MRKKKIPSQLNASNIKEFIAKVKEVHGNYYDYSKIVFTRARARIVLVCKLHGQFKIMPNKLLSGRGCRKCKISKGELKTARFLEENKITFDREYSLPNSYYRYDFYLPKLKILIEYDGIQHFKPVKYFGGKRKFKLTTTRDEDKNRLAAMHKLHLIRIPYTEYKNLEKYLEKRIRKIYIYKYKNRYFRTFLEFSKALRLPKDVLVKTYNKYKYRS